MPHKGIFTQGAAILLSERVGIEELKTALRSYEVTKTTSGSESWEIAGPSVVVSYRPQVNGYVSVDIADRPWPDSMGDPKKEPMLFSAWSMGHFGPFAYPGNLARACQQSWAWPEAREVVPRHAGFLRILSSYVFGRTRDDKCPVMPSDYEPLPELLFVTKLARTLLDLPQAICCFNPNGESLQTAGSMDELFARQASSGLLPLEIWSNVRMHVLPQEEKWLHMDTVGMGQLDVTDHEACFPRSKFEPNGVANFLRNASDYVLKNGPIIKNGDTMDGPGQIRWQGATFEDGIAPPPRQVLRWLPLDRSPRPKGIQGE